jgi:hypothetical protein
MDAVYIVNKGRSIVTKRGVFGPGKEITPKECKNFEKLIEKEWIIKKENLVIQEKEDINIIPEPVKIEEVEPEEVKKIQVIKKETKNKLKNKKEGLKSQFGAVKKEEIEDDISQPEEIKKVIDIEDIEENE